jgi:hypothetical protein
MKKIFHQVRQIASSSWPRRGVLGNLPTSKGTKGAGKSARKSEEKNAVESK